MRIKKSVNGLLLLFLAAVLLLILKIQLKFLQAKQLTTRTEMTAVPCNSLRYSTLDEMKYILYGIGKNLSVYDKQLIGYIRSHISQPSLEKPRNLTTRNSDMSQVGQSKLVDKLLFGRRNGFFIECGAYDGETNSNTLFFELERNWTGLLIEANPYDYRTLMDKYRRAYHLNTCLNMENQPATVNLLQANEYSHIVYETAPGYHRKAPQVVVNCFPLNAITTAIGISHVDYLSLDVEGPEIDILHTIDWTRLRIDVISVEYRVLNFALGYKRLNKTATLKKLKDLRQFFRDTSMYREVTILPTGSERLGLDVVFSTVEP